jgi:hypothetical protein
MMKSGFSLFVLSVVCLSGAGASAQSSAAPAPAWRARLTKVSGDVQIRAAGGPSFSAAKAGRKLAEGDEVRTGRGGVAELALDGDAVLQLKPRSDFTLSKTDKSSSFVTLALGTVLAKLHRLASNRAFEVRTPTAVAAVRGTEFGVSVERSLTRVGVFSEGLVEISDSAGHQLTLAPGQESEVPEGGPPSAAAKLKAFASYAADMRSLNSRLEQIKKDWTERGERMDEEREQRGDRERSRGR